MTELGVAHFDTNSERLISRARPDIVAIAVPAVAHEEEVARAIAGGAHILIEKPLAPDAARARRIAVAVEDAGLKSAYAATARYHDGAELARRLVAGGAIGELVEIEMVSHFHWSSLLPYSWAHSLALGGGRLNNNLPHKLSIAEAVTDGVIVHSYGQARNDLPRAPVGPIPRDFRDWASSPVPPDQAAAAEWVPADADWSYTVLATIKTGLNQQTDHVSAMFRHSGLRRGAIRNYAALYGTAGTIHVDHAYMQGSVLLWREGEEGFAPVGNDRRRGWQQTQTAWNRLVAHFVNDISGAPHERYLTAADGARYQEIIDNARLPVMAAQSHHSLDPLSGEQKERTSQ